MIFGDALTDARQGARAAPPAHRVSSKRDPFRQLPSADLQWTGSDNNVQGSLRCSRAGDPRRQGSNMLGDYKKGEHHVWLSRAAPSERTASWNRRP